MQEQEAKAERQYPPRNRPMSNSLPTKEEIRLRGAQCLRAIRKSARSNPPARTLEGGTNPIDRDMEIFLFHEILTLHSAASIAQNLSFNGLYNNPSLFPAAFKYLHAGRARLTEDSVLAHVRWRLCRWPWWPAAWERAMLGVEGRDGMGVVVGGSLEALAWAVHEAGFRERAGRGEGGGCCHGETVGGEGCCGGLGGL